MKGWAEFLAGQAHLDGPGREFLHPRDQRQGEAGSQEPGHKASVTSTEHHLMSAWQIGRTGDRGRVLRGSGMQLT